MGKISVAFILSRHWSTIFKNPNTGKIEPKFGIIYSLVPIVVGTTWTLLLHFTDVLGAGLVRSDVMTAVTILVGFLFGLLVWVFQLRRDYTPSLLVTTDKSITKLLDEVFANTSYAVLLSGVIVTLSLVGTGVPAILHALGEGTAAALLAHLALTLLLLIRRTASAYQKLATEKDDEREALHQKPARAPRHEHRSSVSPR